MMGKGPNIPADMVFLDLEDAVAPKEKEASRARIVSAFRGNVWGDKVLCVRVNDWST
jgi:citrate lyase subunit beta/citryl-CoA lyase